MNYRYSLGELVVLLQPLTLWRVEYVEYGITKVVGDKSSPWAEMFNAPLFIQ